MCAVDVSCWTCTLHPRPPPLLWTEHGDWAFWPSAVYDMLVAAAVFSGRRLTARLGFSYVATVVVDPDVPGLGCRCLVLRRRLFQRLRRYSRHRRCTTPTDERAASCPRRRCRHCRCPWPHCITRRCSWIHQRCRFRRHHRSPPSAADRSESPAHRRHCRRLRRCHRPLRRS